MNEPAPSPLPPDPQRASALVFAWISLLGTGLPAGMILLIAATSDGPGTMAAILPMLFLLFTGWIWLILAVVALTKASRARRPLLPSALSWLSIALLALSVLPQLAGR